jgi:hypothetical protein
MPASTKKKDLKTAVIKFIDGTAITPLETEVLLGTGNLTYTVSLANEYEANRGDIETGDVTKADEVAVQVNITAKWIDVVSEITESSEPVTPYEALTKTGNAADWVSVGADSCEPFAVILQITFTPDCTGATQKWPEVYTFNEFRVDNCQFDVSAGTMVISGQSKEVAPTVTRGPDPTP